MGLVSDKFVEEEIVRPKELGVINAVFDARDLLEAGFTTVKDCGSRGGIFLKKAMKEKWSKGIITKWERKHCETGMRLRHLMSHLTRTQILTPSHTLQAVEFAVDIINKLYSSSMVFNAPTQTYIVNHNHV